MGEYNHLEKNAPKVINVTDKTLNAKNARNIGIHDEMQIAR